VAILIGSIFTVLLFLGASFIVRQYVAPFDGPLKVQIKNEMHQNVLRASLYSMTINGSSIEIPRVRQPVDLEQSWESETAINVALSTRVVGEPGLFFSVVPRELGLLGSDRGKLLTLLVTVEEEHFAVELFSGPPEENSVLQTKRTLRVNFDKLLAECSLELTREVSSELRFASGVYSKYTGAVREARLDGTRTLPYTTWASRSRNLQGLIQNIRNSAPNYSGQIGSENWKAMIDSLRDIEAAWRNLQTVALAESDSRWDSAWERIYAREAELASKANDVSRIAILIKDQCVDRLTN
jgi:hypothetical protein